MIGLEWLSWRQPAFLLALCMPLLLLLWRRFKEQSSQQSYADKHLWPNLKASGPSRRGYRRYALFSPLTLLILAWSSLVIAMAGPKIYQQSTDSQSLQGVDIMLVLDLSRSMLASEPGQPSRFENARRLAQSFSKQLQPQDRVGLMAFSGSAHLVSPLAFDKSLIVEDLELLYPGLVPLDGSWLEPAIIRGLQHLEHNQVGSSLSEKIQNRARALVVFSDGAEPFLKPVELSQDLKALPLQDWLQDDLNHLWLLGFGSLQPQAVPDDAHPSGVLHHFGLPVNSALQEGSLRQWTEKAKHADYWRSDGSLTPLLEHLGELRESSRKQSVQAQQWLWLDIGPWFVGAALVLLAMVFMPQIIWIGFFVIAIALLSTKVFASAEEQEAFQLYQQQEFVQSQQAYAVLAAERAQQPNEFSAWFGAGAAAYKAQDYAAAVRYFRQAAWLADNDDLRAKALFNLGNSYYLASLPTPAVEAFEQALLYRSPYAEAEHNLALAKQRCEEELAMRRKKQDGDDAEGESSGRGEQQDGAFYGGQKPNSSQSDEEGFGADGDAMGGERNGDKPPLPEQSDYALYQLESGSKDFVAGSAGRAESAAVQIQRQESRLKNARQFAAEVAVLESQQRRLLKRLFEAEAGFHAEQDETHAIPGIQPW
ncbi:VWA domain-containing protein [Thiomicrorhabdus sp. 6S3-12]|uniref:vWA domain-containing protein n=1 Tax=Thiomicrorhabdus sp. 6S3-12 TaxID=2819681 RepID=UPI001AACF052|nr:VWA domain-containing protein [Thiomicrorhabdus sp. 6S3-12]MBO1924787.1 VWA domain-containing protein [Thiomicrorhabdus sp. 6S3-12]